jgi:xylan 1,4-beta-xylosidase
VNLEGALTWAFEFEDQPYFAGFRAIASNGIDLPVLNVFRMFSQMRGQRVATESSAQIPLATIMTSGVREQPDVGVLASANDSTVAVLVWHYHDDDVAGPDADVSLALAGLPAGGIRLTHYRIDETHSNAYAAWRRMGSPIAPNDTQYQALLDASQLARMEPPTPVRGESGETVVRFTLPRQGVSLLVVERVR